MVTAMHQSPASWVMNAIAEWREGALLGAENISNIKPAASTVRAFFGSFAGRSKTPDMAIITRIKARPRPYLSVVLETGCTESQRQLYRDVQTLTTPVGSGDLSPPAASVEEPFTTIHELFGGSTSAGLGDDRQLPLNLERLHACLQSEILALGHLRT
ncbi:hypothetical protein HOY80DRAFT_1045711 [Tuber brumale]|nr:hypothetical protein HOY80DRAFT_1045711 [Tuber brumale]